MKIPKETKQTTAAAPLSKWIRITGNVLLVLTLLLFVWLMSGAVAYGWLLHADSYGEQTAAYGTWYFVCAAGMTAAVILYFCRQDLIAAVLGTGSYLPMLFILLRAVETAEANGWVGQTEQSFARNAATVWRNGMMWNAVTLLLLLALALTRFLSYDAVVKRRERKQKREAALNAPAPSILADAECQSPTQTPPVRQQSANTGKRRNKANLK